MATDSVPVVSTGGSVRSVITGNVSLGFLTEILGSLPMGETGYAFLVSPSGWFLAHPTCSLVMREPIFGIAGFASGAPQSDEITILAFRYLGTGSGAEATRA